MFALDLIAKETILEAIRADDEARGRALAKLALIEARLDLQRATVLRASRYYDRIIERFERA